MPTKKTPAKKPAKPVPAGAAPPTLPFRLEAVQARTLTPNPQNWRTHPDRQLSALSAVLKDPEVGWAGALLFNERTGRLVDGHGRLKVVDPDDDVPVLIGSWSEAAEKKILLTLDPLAGLATADAGQLETLRGCVDDLDGDPFKGLNAELDDLLKDAKREEKHRADDDRRPVEDHHRLQERGAAGGADRGVHQPRFELYRAERLIRSPSPLYSGERAGVRSRGRYTARMRYHVRENFLNENVRVLVDGVDVTNRCFAFDDEAGWAECYIRDVAGRTRLVRRNGQIEVATERLFGVVTVETKPLAARGIHPLPG
jgi:hypothetical protein